MTETVSRRRFLIDLACVGGALLLAAGLGALPGLPLQTAGQTPSPRQRPVSLLPEETLVAPTAQNCTFGYTSITGLIERP